MPRESKTGLTVEEIKSDDLYGVLIKSEGENLALSDEAILRKLYAAEDFYERDLQMRFKQTRVFSDVFGRQNGVFPADTTFALPGDYDPLTDIDEPAYNYPDYFFNYSTWGQFTLNYRPIINIERLAFAFPGTRPLYTPPKNWLRIDRKYGTVQIVPSSGEVLVSVLAGFILRIAGGARGVPQSIFVDYTIGFLPGELEQNHQDLIEGVKLRTIMNLGGIISSIANPGGKGSLELEVDNLRKKTSYTGKYGAYSGKIELAMTMENEIRENWKKRDKGPVLAFV